MSRNDNRKNTNMGKVIGLLIVLMISQPALFIPLAVFGGIIYLAVKAVAKQQGSPKSGNSSHRREANRRESFDECPQPFFCFHKDKGEHHVRRGKEIDPWDRPDIDISKYQRNR